MIGTVILHQIARKVRACDFLDGEQNDELSKEMVQILSRSTNVLHFEMLRG